MHKKINIIVIVDQQYGYAKEGGIPWHFRKELQYFSKTTKSIKDPKKIHAIIMGRKTWLTLPKYGLKNRVNIVVSNTLSNSDLPKKKSSNTKLLLATSLKKSIELCYKNDNIESIFIIGGGRLFKESLELKLVDCVYMTTVHKDYNCDQFFPKELLSSSISSEIEKGWDHIKLQDTKSNNEYIEIDVTKLFFNSKKY